MEDRHVARKIVMGVCGATRIVPRQRKGRVVRRNNGNQTKKITVVVPESVEVIDITYYWKTATGQTIKTATTIMDENCMDGNEVVCYAFPEEEEV